MSFIELKNIYKIFGRSPQKALVLLKGAENKDSLLENSQNHVGLSNINLSINQGEIFIIMGLSGSGKSTLVRHLNRLIEPTDGEVIVDGTNILNFDKTELLNFRRKKISMVFQKFGLLPHKTVLANVAFGLSIQGVSKDEQKTIATTWLEKVGLENDADSYPRQLSGGMQQRVGLARALATDPEILLMDEPFSALDPLIKRDMQKVLLKLQQSLHKTIVFITHDLDEALHLGDRIAILKDGELIQCDRPQEILDNPADDYIKEFVKDVRYAREEPQK